MLGGFTMVTHQPVKAGAQLLSVPRSLFMSADTASACPLVGPLVEAAGLDDWQALILHLLVERARPDSAWGPYVALLERADMRYHPLLWSSEQREWLAGSPMARTLAARRAQVEGDAAVLVEAGANKLQVPGRGGSGSGSAAANVSPLVTPDSVAWAAAVLLSRAFSLYLSEPDHSIVPIEDFGSWDRSGQDVLALVPWADLLQHSSEAGENKKPCASVCWCCDSVAAPHFASKLRRLCSVWPVSSATTPLHALHPSGDVSVLRYEFDTDAACLCAHRDYAAGEEVHDSYGPGLSPCDLLMDYGFVDPHNVNDRWAREDRCTVKSKDAW